MRLSTYQQTVIKRAAQKHFGDHVAVFVFGSRVDDEQKGGDIDLLIETILSKEEKHQRQMNMFVELQNKLGEQKIDILVYTLDDVDDEPQMIYQEAKRTGVML